MSPTTLRIIVIVLSAIAAALSFFLGASQQLGVDPMVAVIIGAVLAAINVILGFLPSFAGQSGIEPGKTEKEVARGAYTAGLDKKDVPRGLV